MSDTGLGPTADDPLAVFRDLRDRSLRDGVGRAARDRTEKDGTGPHDTGEYGTGEHGTGRYDADRSGAGTGLFIAESLLVVERVLAAGLEVERVVVTPRGAARLGAVLDPVRDRTVVLPDAELAALAGYPVHRGVLAAVRRPPERSVAEVLAGARSIVVVEDLTDPENLGAIVRSAVALGVDGLLLSPRCTDPLYRRTVRVSMGEVLRLPWARVEPWPDGLAELRGAGFHTVVVTGDGAGDVADLRGHVGRLAIVLGSEADGLSTAVRSWCDASARIPMRPGSDSLNVAAAAAIAFHAIGRVGEVGDPAARLDGAAGRFG